MPTNIELRAIQKRNLHHLLRIKRELGNVPSNELDHYISVTMAEMEAEDVAYVQKIVEGN